VTLPNFLIIGAQKSGTSWLADMLSQHPDVFVARGEIHYFDKVQNFARPLDWYASHFEGVRGERAVGEKSPDYLWANGRGEEGHDPDVHRNLHGVLPGAKLVVSLRNPVDRAISAANHIVRSGRVSPRHELDELLVGDKRHLLARRGVIDYGYYRRQLDAYQELFDPAQMLVLVYEEDIVDDPADGLRRTCEFLEVDPDFEFVTERRVNEMRSSLLSLYARYYLPPARGLARRLDRRLPPARPRRPSPETVRRLEELFAEENERLFEMIGRRVGAWEPTREPERSSGP